jgi:NADPH2:quinone reductase
MRAFIIEDFGKPGVVGERARPEPGEGQILVRVKAAGVNGMDPMIRAGDARHWMEHRMPVTPGLDYAGTVEAVGPGVEQIKPGDEVFGAVGKMYAGEGTFAEYTTANAAVAAKRPEDLPVQVAAALPTAGGAALAAVEALDAKPGDTIAIVGAAGGVGGFATQLAAQRGIHVIAVTSGANADLVRELGAEEVIDHTSTDTVLQLRASVPDGIDGIIDLFHDAQGAASLAAAIKPGGRVVSPVAMGLEQALAGGPVSGHNVRAAINRAAELGALAASGSLVVPLEELPLDRAAEALDRQATHRVRGKLVLRVA